MMIHEPLAIQGFYATRVLARRATIAILISIAMAVTLTLCISAVAALVVDTILIVQQQREPHPWHKPKKLLAP